MSILKTAASCWRQAAEAEKQAAQITDKHLKAVYLRIVDHWSALARSYEFVDSAEHFLLDAKRTKDANSRQPREELAHLPSSLASQEAEHLLKPRSDRRRVRLVPEGPSAEPGAVAA
jgi:hypothetical protein